MTDGAYFSLWHGVVAPPPPRSPTLRRGSRAALRRAAEAFCQEHGYSWSEILGRRRRRAETLPRQHLMAALYEEGLWSLPEIGRLLERDHTTVLHGIRAHYARSEHGLNFLSPTAPTRAVA